MRFDIPEITVSQNPWERMHWSSRQKDKELWFWLVKAAIGVVNATEERKHVHITRVANRLIDDQNLPAGCKYLVDAIQAFGHIYRDSRKYTRVTFDQRQCKPNEAPHMEVEINSLEESGERQNEAP